MTTKLALEQLIKGKDNQWILRSPMIISRMRSPSVSIATSTVIWKRDADWKRRNEKHEHVLNVTKKGHIAKDCKGKQIMKK